MRVRDFILGRATARPRTRNISVPTSATGVVATVPSGLASPITVTRDSGSASITFSASGTNITASIASALSAGTSLSAVARATRADGSGVLIPVTLTGAVVLSAITLSAGTATTGNLWSATITGKTTGSTITATSSDGTAITVSGTTVSGTFTATGSPTVTLTETLAGASNSGRTSSGTITVSLSPTLGALALSSTTFTIGTPSSGTVTGATAGSSIGSTGLPTGLTINGAARTWSYDGSGSVASATVVLTETLAGASNNPRDTNVSVSVVAGVPAAPAVTLTAGNTQVSIAYSPNSNGGAAITGYNLYAGASAGSLALLGFIPVASASPYVETGLTNGVARFYAVAAVNSVGEGARSATQSATPTVATPTTADYTYAQISGGLNGSLDYTGTASRTMFQSAASAFITGAWSGKITGTYADILMFQGGSQPAGMVEVSVNGGPYTAAPLVSGRYVLFTGLPQATYNVVVRINAAYGSSAGIPNTGNVLKVTGAPPSVVVAGVTVQAGENNANTIATNTLIQNPTIPFVATFTPLNIIDGDNVTRINVPALALRGDPTELIITTRSQYVYVSVDGAAPTRYDLGTGNTETRMVNITGLSGTKTYYVWGGKSQYGLNQMAVGFVGGTGLSNIATKRRMDQYGDSITEGVSATSPGDVEIFRVGASLGYLGGNFGLAGDNVAGLNTRVTTILARKTGSSAVGANDVAVIAIGRNNTGGAFSAGVIADYQAMINKLLTAGYRRVLCRGILPDGVTTWPAENGSISSIVTGFADARVKFVDTSTWAGIATADGTHPPDAGYATIAGYAAAAYPALIV